tara:strand:- start:134 stop:979 length:846 start_codon:yes stop_codon:yes gene_type:complete
MNYRKIISKGRSILEKHSILNADIDSELLLSISLNKSRTNILLNSEDKLNKIQINNYFKLINRRKKKEPISFISGRRFFWKYDFIVNKNVLTPRFETELLLDEVLKIYKHSNNIKVLDIGLGSGCILISLLKEKKRWKGDGVDISKLSLKTAKTNAKMQQVENRMRFIHSNIDNLNCGKYDLIVSNPPYINRIEYNNLGLEVKDYEPLEALYGGIDGFRIIEKIIKKSNIILKYNGLLAMEIGLGQHFKVLELLKNNGFFTVKIIKDYQKIKRCLIAKKIK